MHASTLNSIWLPAFSPTPPWLPVWLHNEVQNHQRADRKQRNGNLGALVHRRSIEERWEVLSIPGQKRGCLLQTLSWKFGQAWWVQMICHIRNYIWLYIIIYNGVSFMSICAMVLNVYHQHIPRTQYSTPGWHPDCRPWMYNSNVNEYWVILDDKSMHKKTDMTRELEETRLADSQLYVFSCCSSFKVFMVGYTFLPTDAGD